MMNILSLPVWAYGLWLALLGAALLVRYRFSHRPYFWFGVFRRFLWTLLAAWAGAVVTMLWASVIFQLTSDSRGSLVPLVISLTAYAWLFFILPIALLFQDRSRIYRFRFSIPLGLVLSLVALQLYVTSTDLAAHRPFTFFRLFQTFPLTLTFPILFGLCVSTTLSIAAAIATRPRRPRETDLAAGESAPSLSL